MFVHVLKMLSQLGKALMNQFWMKRVELWELITLLFHYIFPAMIVASRHLNNVFKLYKQKKMKQQILLQDQQKKHRLLKKFFLLLIMLLTHCHYIKDLSPISNARVSVLCRSSLILKLQVMDQLHKHVKNYFLTNFWMSYNLSNKHWVFLQVLDLLDLSCQLTSLNNMIKMVRLS